MANIFKHLLLRLRLDRTFLFGMAFAWRFGNPARRPAPNLPGNGTGMELPPPTRKETNALPWLTTWTKLPLKVI